MPDYYMKSEAQQTHTTEEDLKLSEEEDICVLQIVRVTGEQHDEGNTLY